MEIEVFKNNGWEIRAIEKDGEPWFIAKDVASSLGYSNTSKAVQNHCKKSNDFSTSQNGSGYVPPMKIIPESDVYRLIMRSHLESAEQFQDWVVEEVLPSIRENGKYDPQLPKTLPEALRAYADEVEAHNETKKIAIEMKPKADFYDTVVDSKDAVSFREAAKLLAMKMDGVGKPVGQNQLFEYCRDNGILMQNNEPYQNKVDQGYFKIIESKYTNGDMTKISKKTLLLQKGLDYIRKKMERDGFRQVL